jgi:hypothetical protein
VPQAGYKFLEAMDRLIGQLPVEAPANPPGWQKTLYIRQINYIILFTLLLFRAIF